MTESVEPLDNPIARLLPTALFFLPVGAPSKFALEGSGQDPFYPYVGVEWHAEAARPAYTYADQQWRQEKPSVVHHPGRGQGS